MEKHPSRGGGTQIISFHQDPQDPQKHLPPTGMNALLRPGGHPHRKERAMIKPSSVALTGHSPKSLLTKLMLLE